MLQRKQTLYLLAGFILTLLVLFCKYLTIEMPMGPGLTVDITLRSWGGYMGNAMQFPTYHLLALVIITALVNFVTIFLYRKRWVQVRFCLAMIVLHLGIGGFMIYYVVQIQEAFPAGLDLAVRYSVISLLPFFSAVASYLAYRGVAHDIALLRSVDRIR